jgi:hypothetical protein
MFQLGREGTVYTFARTTPAVRELQPYRLVPAPTLSRAATYLDGQTLYSTGLNYPVQSSLPWYRDLASQNRGC